MKILRRIVINLLLVILGVTCTVTYSKYVTKVEKSGTINGKRITASDVSYTNAGSPSNVQNVQDAIDELYAMFE